MNTNSDEEKPREVKKDSEDSGNSCKGTQSVDFEKIEIEEPTCSLYISRVGEHCQVQGHCSNDVVLSRAKLEDAIRTSWPSGTWKVRQTPCGLIAAFTKEIDVDKFIQGVDLARVLDGPVQVARFSAKDSRYRQMVLLHDVPWAIPLQDLNSALTKQGISFGNIERSRQYVRVEVLDASQYERLLHRGLDFFGAVRFNAVPERTWRGNFSGASPGMFQVPNVGGNFSEMNSQQGDQVLQCFRCQGFWHVAANCRQLPRCVRCGEPHSVEFCPRPRNDPICCHCSGQHHAGHRQCPVRLQLLNATPVSLTLSTNRSKQNITQIHPPKFN